MTNQSHANPIDEKRGKFDNTLEGARGVAAVVVMLSHSLVTPSNPSSPDPHFGPTSIVDRLFIGHVAVMFFFILSGYVIGMNHQSEYTPGGAIQFYKKRLIRLFPIYIIAIAISWALSPGTDSATTIVGHLFFCQGIFVRLLHNNPALWSLSCEAVYYLVFPLVWKYKLDPLKTAAGAILLSVLLYAIRWVPDFVSGYIAGYCFWLVGLALVSRPKTKPASVSPISLYLIMAGTASLSPGAVLFHGLHLSQRTSSTLSTEDLFLLPAVAVAFGLLARRELPAGKWIAIIALLIPTVQIALLWHMHALFATEWRQVGIAFLLLAIPLQLIARPIAPSDFLSNIGRISYALYCIHSPFLVALHFVTALPSGTWLSFLSRYALWLVVTISIAWFLEGVVQPAVKRNFSKLKNPLPTPMT